MNNIVRFDCYEVDLLAGQLYKRGNRVNLREKSFQILTMLLEHPGEVVMRENLREHLWGADVFVDFENNLNGAIARLREVLHDSAEHPRFIETLPRRGYRFICRVSAEDAQARGSIRKARLVILPFINLTGDPGQEYFSDAMTDEIITALAAIAPEQLAIIARTTAMRYRHSRKDVAHIGRELGVDYVVEGGVGSSGDRIYVNIQLLRAADQTHLFAQRYDIQMNKIFNLHREISLAITKHVPVIANALSEGVTLRLDVRRKPTEDLAAYNEYIKGRWEMWKMTAEGTAEARRHFEAALARDPEFALVCNALAELYWYAGIFGYAPSKDVDSLGRSYVLRAMKTDSTSAETHALLSFYPGRRDRPEEIDYYDWSQIQKEVARARDLDPTLRLVRLRYAMVLAMRGQPDAAAEELDQALQSDPLSFDVRCWLISMLYLGHQLERALAETYRLLDLEPEHFLSYYMLGHVYREMQRFDESATAFRKAVELSHELPVVVGFLGLTLGLGGHKSDAQAVLARLLVLASQRHVPPTCFAWTHLGLGNIDEAFFWLDRAIDAPDRFMEAIRAFPFVDPLRDDPRFALLLQKMNLT